MHFGRSSLVNASPALRYGVVISFLLLASLLRIGLAAIVNRPISAPIFLVAIILSTWLGGFRLGLFASIGASLTLDYFFVQPILGTLDFNDHVIRFILFVAEGGFVSWLIDKLRLTADELTSSREELRELAEQHRTARDNEQKRIAREIHDELGQSLTSLKLGIHLIKQHLLASKSNNNKPRADVVTEIDELSKQVDLTIGSVRRIATELRPSILDDFGLAAAIEWQAKEFENRSGVECIFTSNTSSISVDSDASTAIFRIFQEALTNIARHAEATRVRVKIEETDDRIRLVVEDNGKGIGNRARSGSKSLGILGMRERARLIGGELTVADSLRGGTRVEFVAPLIPSRPSANGDIND